MRASHTASGASRSGPRIGRHRLITCTRPFSNSSASSGNRSRTRCGPESRGVVDMHAGRRLARPAGRAVGQARDAAALQMVEDKDAAGAGDLGDEALRLRVVDPPHLVVVPEVAHRAVLLDEREALPVELDFRGDRPHVADAHLVRARAACSSGSRRGPAHRRNSAGARSSVRDSSARPRHRAGVRDCSRLGPP